MPAIKSKERTGKGAKRTKSRKLVKTVDDAQAQARLELKFKQVASLRALREEPPKPKGKYDDKSDFLKWIYSIPFSRPLRFLAKDFSDGVLVAELIKHYAPLKVDLHNYLPYVGKTNKISNWVLLNRKVFSRHFNMTVSPPMIDLFVSPSPKDAVDICDNKWYPIEKFLVDFRDKLAKVNPNLYKYREGPSNYMNSTTSRAGRVIRPLTRQPVTEIMWRVEKLNASKYGRYKGNPIIWDNIPEYFEKATLVQLGIGVSSERYRRIKECFREQKLNEISENALKSSSHSLSVDNVQCTNKFPEDLQQHSTKSLLHANACPCSFANSQSNSNFYRTSNMRYTSDSTSVHSAFSPTFPGCGLSESGSAPNNLPYPKPPQRRYKIACPVPCCIETNFPVNLVCSPDSTSIKIVSASCTPEQAQNSHVVL